MPAAAKTAKTKAGKAASDFYVVRTFQKITDNATAAFNDYNEKVVKKAMANTVTMAKDVRKNTVLAFDGVVADGRKVISLIPVVGDMVPKQEKDEKATYFVVESIKTARVSAAAALKEYNVAVKKTMENPRGLLDTVSKKTIENSRVFVEGVRKSTLAAITEVRKNAIEAMNGIAGDGKKIAERATAAVKTARTKAEDALRQQTAKVLSTVTKALDLPSKKDIEKLTAAMKEFNKKADSVAK
ncbi:MAG: hypothetical protein AB1921_03545 [Thermodesulfobacteriota bacterium]